MKYYRNNDLTFLEPSPVFSKCYLALCCSLYWYANLCFSYIFWYSFPLYMHSNIRLFCCDGLTLVTHSNYLALEWVWVWVCFFCVCQSIGVQLYSGNTFSPSSSGCWKIIFIRIYDSLKLLSITERQLRKIAIGRGLPLLCWQIVFSL